MNVDQEIALLLRESIIFKSSMDNAYRELQSPKDAKASEIARKKGNVLFIKKRHSLDLHTEILSLYSESAALAPNGSQELAFAYGNRSAFLLHIERYQECINDIDKALEINKSNEFKIKLLCRKVECFKKLGITCGSILDEAQNLADNFSEGADDKKQTFHEMVTKASALLVAEKKETSQKTSETCHLPVSKNVLENVSISYDEKYGRHLVAKRNYNPGDIIFVEQFFLSTVELPNRYVNCHHCLKDSWTGIPCHNCNWAIFCSQECSDRAWKEYHDIECSVGTLMNDELDIHLWNRCSLGVKIFLKAMKDAGSIDNLRAQLEAVDQNTDLCSKGFYKDGKFTDNVIESFCSLTKWKFTPDEEKIISWVALLTLICLLKHPQWRDIFSLKKGEDLMQNQDVVYLGSLLIKFIAIQFNNALAVVHFQSMNDTWKYGNLGYPRGCCIGRFTSLINSSCCSNANRSFTQDGKIIIYAVQSIEKRSQIFINYASEYYVHDFQKRKSYLMNYNMECDCRACIEFWPPLLLQSTLSGDIRSALMIVIATGNYNHPKLLQLLDYGHDKKANIAEAEFMKECSNIVVAIAANNYGKATLEKLIPNIAQAFKRLKQPSLFTCMMQDALNSCVKNVYNGFKLQTFGDCKKM